MLKMAALFALVWIAMRVWALPLLPFALGISVFVVSILLVGLFSTPDEEGQAEAGDGDKVEA
jgi:hypothetical protein